MAREIEAKIALSPATMLSLLDNLSGRLPFRQAPGQGDHDTWHESNFLFDRGEDLRKEGKILRVRAQKRLGRFCRKAVLTYKGPLEEGEYKIRPEEEVEFDYCDLEDMMSILRGLGYEKVFEYEKIRREFRLGDFSVAVDTLPHIFHFLEVEAADTDRLGAFLAELQVSHLPSIRDGYPTLLRRHVDNQPDWSGSRFAFRFSQDELAAFSHNFVGSAGFMRLTGPERNFS
jgi:predicted adenylyl cyclase CyaB